MASELQTQAPLGIEAEPIGAGALSPESFGPARILNRELSWLDFAARLLDLAEDYSTPLLERVKFLSIFSTGLDEFFQVRVAGLKDQLEAGLNVHSTDGLSPSEQLERIREKANALVRRQATIFAKAVHPALRVHGIDIVGYADLDEKGIVETREIFEQEIFPVLTPLAVDPGHPFPYISNLSLNLAVWVEDPISGERRFARVKVPPLLPRFVAFGHGERYVALEEVIAANLDQLFPDMRIVAEHALRVTCNVDLDLDEDEADDLLMAVEMELRRRRFGRVVRLEVEPSMSSDFVELLLRELELVDADCYAPDVPLDLGQLWELLDLNRPDLKEEPWAPTTQPRLVAIKDEQVDMFAVIRERDVLVHHPFDSFVSSVEEFIAQAADDPDVLAIKQTLYRTSGDTPFVAALIRAAENGKQVAALVELKARFDEQRNILWARQLEQAGVHVVYGVVGLKTHSKTALVVRREADGIRRYCHIGTGNYNSATARVYEDLGLLTCDRAIGEDLTDLFNHLTGFSRPTSMRTLIMSPEGFRPWVLAEIEREAAAGPLGHIAIKVNGLTDPEVIDVLYRASQAGVPIELVVRGVCSLRPGVPGLSETITVRSIVGRFLEHSRIYRFGVPPEEVLADCAVPPINTRTSTCPCRYVIGSADLMERNLDRRIEALTPVRDPELCARLEDILTLDLSDNCFAWILAEDGSWSRHQTAGGVSAQVSLEELAIERAKRRWPIETA